MSRILLAEKGREMAAALLDTALPRIGGLRVLE